MHLHFDCNPVLLYRADRGSTCCMRRAGDRLDAACDVLHVLLAEENSLPGLWLLNWLTKRIQVLNHCRSVPCVMWLVVLALDTGIGVFLGSAALSLAGLDRAIPN